MTSGIYKIVNKSNGKYYVGSSSRWERRRVRHKSDLVCGIHDNQHLQSSWKKYGENNFDFLLVEECNPDMLLKREQEYLNIAEKEKDKCYNMNFNAERPPDWTIERRQKASLRVSGKNNPNFGKHVTEEIRLKLRAAKLGKRLSVEHSKNIALALVGNKYNLGRKMSAKNKAKLLEVMTGHNNPRFDHRIYNFYNIISKEIFTGTRYDLQHKFGLRNGDLCKVIQGKRTHVKKWSLMPTP